MSQSHRERYITKLIIGFSSLIASVLVIFYAAFELSRRDEWVFWAIVAAFLLCGGVYFSLGAFTHKIKSDFSKRQKAREEQKALNKE